MHVQVICADPAGGESGPPELDLDDLCDGSDVHLGPGELPGLPIGPSQEPYYEASCDGELQHAIQCQLLM